MILERLSRAIRAQNWFAVATEFVIVILGVVIGFQINDWAQNRARTERAQEMMASLAADLEAERWRIAATSAYLKDMAAEAQAALDAMTGVQPLGDEDLVIKAFRGSQYFWAGVIRSTYDELVAGGEINLVPDGVFRDAAIEYFNSSSASLLSDLGETPYRDAFRQRISPGLHRALVEQCAEDPSIQIGDYASLENFLDFHCDIQGHDAEFTQLAERLRADEELIGLLRWRVIEADQDQNNLVYFADLLDRALEGHALESEAP